MNKTLEAVILEVSGDNIRSCHINLHGAFGLFPGDGFGGRDTSTTAKPIRLDVGAETVDTDIDEAKAIFREHGAIRRFFDGEDVVEGDLLLIERVSDRSYRLSKASERGFRYYL